MEVVEPIEESPPPLTDKEIVEQIKMAEAHQPKGQRVCGLIPI